MRVELKALLAETTKLRATARTLLALAEELEAAFIHDKKEPLPALNFYDNVTVFWDHVKERYEFPDSLWSRTINALDTEHSNLFKRRRPSMTVDDLSNLVKLYGLPSQHAHQWLRIPNVGRNSYKLLCSIENHLPQR